MMYLEVECVLFPEPRKYSRMNLEGTSHYTSRITLLKSKFYLILRNNSPQDKMGLYNPLDFDLKNINSMIKLIT